MLRRPVAARVAPVIHALLGPTPPVAIRFWDGSVVGPPPGRSAGVIEVRSKHALRRLLWAPDELGMSRAYVAGDLDITGDVFAVLALRDAMASPDEGVSLGFRGREWLTLGRAALSVGAIGRPPPPPPEEARLGGARHSKTRDQGAVRHHYDVSNDFYRLVLGPTMTYSCGYWDDGVTTLEEAQEAKYGHICQKLGLRAGMRLLDVGCGWGGMVLHAARRHGVDAVGITVSPAQQQMARDRVVAAGLVGRVEIRLQDYRDLAGERFDAISSIGMFEHVGEARLTDYTRVLRGLLRPEGRLLNHGISRPAGPPPHNRRGFIDRYVFPDGELHEVGRVISGLQEVGLEVRDAESLREHYALTLRRWVANLEASWDEAVALVGPNRARIWRLYMAGSAVNFEEGRTMIHQVLAVAPGTRGRSGMPRTRRAWYAGQTLGSGGGNGAGDGLGVRAEGTAPGKS